MAELIKVVFAVTITTARMVFPGIPTGPEGEATAARSLSMEVMSHAKAGAAAKATVAVPEGLKLGGSVELSVEKISEPVESKPPTEAEDQMPKFTAKYYWGCGESVPEGQPKTEGWAPAARDSGPEYPTGSYAYWPDARAKPLADDAAAAGTYKLTTDYAGGATANVGQDQDFMAPVEITSPGDKPDFTKPIKVEWKKVPNAVAYSVSASGGKANEAVEWVSGSQAGQVFDPISYPLAGDGLKIALESGLLLSPETTCCTIPAGIFRGSDLVMLTVTALGRDSVQTKDGVRTQVIVRSTATVAFSAEALLRSPE